MLLIELIQCVKYNQSFPNENNIYIFLCLIQDYEVLNLLGKGGFASVYRARCFKNSMEVAIKMVS